eukprot:58508_1
MTISYFNGNPYQQCGLITSGGTDSICMAIRTFKQYSKSIKLILPKSAHAAFHKACVRNQIKPIMILLIQLRSKLIVIPLESLVVLQIMHMESLMILNL